MMRLVPVSVVMAGAAFEANANELIQEILDGSAHLTASRKEVAQRPERRSLGQCLGQVSAVGSPDGQGAGHGHGALAQCESPSESCISGPHGMTRPFTAVLSSKI